MRHLDVPEMLILLGAVAFVGLAAYNWFLSHTGRRRRHHERRVH